MRGVQKSKRVYWPPDFKLCQVRLFLSEDAPSQVGSGAQDHLQAKSHLSDENLPPGFAGSHVTSKSQIELSDISVVKWTCSSKFHMNLEWRVVAGEESKEVKIQNRREINILEEFYPCATAIPPNPLDSVDVEKSLYDDQQTPHVPITPVEDEDAPLDALHMGSQLSQNDANPSIGSSAGVEPDIMAAASAALSAISNNNQANMIDQDMLIKILSNPGFVQNLVAATGSATAAQYIQPAPAALPAPPSTSAAKGVGAVTPPNPSGQCYPQANGTYISPPGFPPAPPSQANFGISQVKDSNYYKNLIQQHGGERPEPVQQLGFRYNHPIGPNHYQTASNQEMVNHNPRPRDSKPKVMKPCMYFNSPRGCRNGTNCQFQHDVAFQTRNPNNGSSISEVQNAKRMKFDREISS